MSTKATSSRPDYLVIYGPPGSGKTLNREALRAHYKCATVVDDWPQRRMLREVSGCVLILSGADHVCDPRDRRRRLKCRYISIGDAAKALGAAWVAPVPGWSECALRWDSFTDEKGNTVLEAVGGTTDGESGDLYYRLKQEVQNNRHVWVEASSPELLIDEESPLSWVNKQQAKNRLQSHHAAVMRSYSSSVTKKL